LSAARDVVLAVLVVVVVLGMIFAPWVLRLVRSLTEERAERIRSQERAEMAAHLHDSVLQTLALIQRSDAPRDMATLARGQERELRAWLYGGARADRPDSLQAGLEALAARIEERHLVAVELVTVGDAVVDGRLQALLEAAGEALTNAARHAGVRHVSLYAEVEADVVNVFVSDQGRGFDPARVPSDRRGIVDSVRGRVHRHGGTVEVSSEPGEGTEVRLCMPRSVL
ncbi:MAG: sensor histidine kinase, partial [Egibacteraceae bacterium]